MPHMSRLSSGRTTFRFQYFAMRNQGEAIRLALHYAKIPFEDQHVTFDQWPTQVKKTTPYGYLPVLEVETDDKRTKIAETTTILRYVGRLTGLAGYNALEEAKVDEFVQLHACEYAEVKPWMQAATGFGPGDMKELFEKTRPIFRKYFSIYIAQLRAVGSGFLVTSGPTVADLYLADYLHSLHNLAPSLFDGQWSELSAYRCRILTLPAIQQYTKIRPKSPI